MKMSDVRVGMKLRAHESPGSPDVTVTRITEKGFEYRHEPVTVKIAPYTFGTSSGGEHYGYGGDAMFEPVPPPPPPPPVDYSQRTLTDGGPVTDDHKDINPETGQQKGYVVLSAAERAKGFVRPVRDSYRHVGIPAPRYPLRDLTAEETVRYQKYGYVKFETYPGDGGVTGRYWTQEHLDKILKGCGGITTMGRSLAETYARDPSYYGGTFCSTCRTHLPVGEHGEFVWLDGERVGT